MQVPQINCIKKFNTTGLPVVIAKKLERLIKVLNKSVINLQELKNLLADGIPDQASTLREYCWKLMFGYLSKEKSEWDRIVREHEKTYQQLITIFFPEEKYPDYPYIITKKHERWAQLEQEFCLWQQIEKDTSRTHAQLAFFTAPASQIMIPFFTSPRKQKFKLINGQDDKLYKTFLVDKKMQRKTYRYDYMSRILYIYAKLNPQVKYVQGMNEVLAPIFYLVNVNKNGVLEEASCFFMFNNAMANIIELHIKDLDHSQSGIHGKLDEINQMLVVIEPRIWSKLVSLKIDPFFYCFRWITLFFAQEFPLCDTLRIWQSIFSCENKILFMSLFSISMIMSAKQFILQHDFVEVLERLQHMGEKLDVHDTLLLSRELYVEFKGHNFKEHSKATKQAIRKKEQKDQGKGKGGNYITNFIKKIWK